MVSKEIGIHPIFTLIGMYTGFKLMGVIGMILGPIVLIILKNVCLEYYQITFVRNENLLLKAFQNTFS